MSNRIRQLEDALVVMQPGASEERHSLLSEELLKIKFGAESLPRTRRVQDEDENDERMQQSIDAVGSMTLNESGEGPYFGRSAGPEVGTVRSLVSSTFLIPGATSHCGLEIRL